MFKLSPQPSPESSTPVEVLQLRVGERLPEEMTGRVAGVDKSGDIIHEIRVRADQEAAGDPALNEAESRLRKSFEHHDKVFGSGNVVVDSFTARRQEQLDQEQLLADLRTRDAEKLDNDRRLVEARDGIEAYGVAG